MWPVLAVSRWEFARIRGVLLWFKVERIHEYLVPKDGRGYYLYRYLKGENPHITAVVMAFPVRAIEA